MCGAHAGSSPSYAVTAPAVTVIRLCPGCVCQPVVPPGAQTLLCTYRSESPCVFWSESQKFPVRRDLKKPSGKSELATSMLPNRPRAMVVLVKPDCGVADTLLENAIITATIAAITTPDICMRRISASLATNPSWSSRTRRSAPQPFRSSCTTGRGARCPTLSSNAVDCRDRTGGLQSDLHPPSGAT